MAKTTIGYAHCPECDSVQAVQSDGLKHFIHCNDCNTFTHYQRKAAKNRIEEKLLTDLSEELEPLEPEPENKTLPEPPVKPKSFFEALADYL